MRDTRDVREPRTLIGQGRAQASGLLPQSRADLAQLQPSCAPRGRGPAHAAARAREVPGHRGLEPGRVPHEAHRRPEAAGRRRLSRSSRWTAARRASRSKSATAPCASCAAGPKRSARSCSRRSSIAASACCPISAPAQAPDQAWVRQHYIDNVFPLVTPQAIDPAHPFPFVSNLSLNLLVARARSARGHHRAHAHQAAHRQRHSALHRGARHAHVRDARRRDRAPPRPALSRHDHRELRPVSRHAQCRRREGRRASRRPARDDRSRAARA